MARRAHNACHRAVHHRRRRRTTGIRKLKGTKRSRRMAGSAVSRPDRNVIGRHRQRGRRTYEAESCGMTGGAGETASRRVHHGGRCSTAYIRHHESREITH